MSALLGLWHVVVQINSSVKFTDKTYIPLRPHTYANASAQSFTLCCTFGEGSLVEEPQTIPDHTEGFRITVMVDYIATIDRPIQSKIHGSLIRA